VLDRLFPRQGRRAAADRGENRHRRRGLERRGRAAFRAGAHGRRRTPVRPQAGQSCPVSRPGRGASRADGHRYRASSAGTRRACLQPGGRNRHPAPGRLAVVAGPHRTLALADGSTGPRARPPRGAPGRRLVPRRSPRKPHGRDPGAGRRRHPARRAGTRGVSGLGASSGRRAGDRRPDRRGPESRSFFWTASG